MRGEVGAQRRAARLAGAMYLLVNATGIFGQIVVRESLFVSGDVARTAQNIINSEGLFRLGILSDVVTFAGVLVLAWALYVLLRAVNRDLAMLGALFRLIEVPVGIAVTVSSLIALRILSDVEHLRAFDTSELHSLSRLATNAFGFGQDLGFVFIGLGSTVFAYLLFKSRYVPRILAGWGVFASLLFTVYNLTIIVFPSAAESLMYVSFAPMGVFEITLGAWLLTKGAKIRPI